MKKLRFSLMVLALLALAACKQPASEEPTEAAEAAETTEAAEAPDYAAFDKNVAIIRSFMKAHEDENFDLQMGLLSDTLKWSPPNYNGNEWLGKEEYVAALKGYHDNYENIKFTEGIVLADGAEGGMWSGSAFPEATATNTPDAIRVYGTWTATHTASGKEIGVKWFGIVWINADGKIAQATDYWDVHGLAAQIAEE
jgi:hypothetical protein